MSTELSSSEVIEIARRLIAEKGIEVSAAEPEIRAVGDYWAVVFDLILPDDVMLQDPSCAIVDVDKKSGAAKLFPCL